MIVGMPPLRILVVATKPPWPPVDGGRIVLLNTIEALATAGHDVELVTPYTGPENDKRTTVAALEKFCVPHLVPADPRSVPGSLSIGLLRGMPIAVARHTLPRVARSVTALVETGGFDVIHAEQLHALAQTETARRMGLPVVHRAHNVESVLWTFTAQHRGPATRSLVALEARRMSAWEVRALEESACTVALTEVDRRALSELVPGASIHTIAAPFAAELPPGEHRLDGNPAVVTLASATWAPSRVAVEHLASEIWPTVQRRLPDAVLHIFGENLDPSIGAGVTNHPPPEDSRSAFAGGAIALVPERHPTGVPMKALEAWARGLPLVADRSTAAVLEAEDGVELIVARHASGYAEALARLVDDDELRRRVVAGGHSALRERHNPEQVAKHLEKVYRWAMETGQRI